MTITTDSIEKLRTAIESGGELPRVQTGTDENGDPVYRQRRNLIGSLNSLQRIATEMDEYGLVLADLPEKKQTEFKQAHDDFQFWVAELTNQLPDEIAGFDDILELPNGNTVDLPNAPIETAAKSVEIPDRPSGGT
jgi:hypothetical protein